MTPSVHHPPARSRAGRGKGSRSGTRARNAAPQGEWQRPDGPRRLERARLRRRAPPTSLPAGRGPGAAGAPLQEFAIQRIALLRRGVDRRCGAGAGAGAAPDAADTAAPAGMLRSSQSCDALKRVQPATVALGASSFHFGWNGGRCSCETLSNIVSTNSARRR